MGEGLLIFEIYFAMYAKKKKKMDAGMFRNVVKSKYSKMLIIESRWYACLS